MHEHIVIVTGATPISDSVASRIPPSAIVIGVDGGRDHALAAGLRPSGLVGDLDSVTRDGREWAAANATIARHPTDKDQTDTELALAFAADMQPERLTLIGGGDRLDHTLAAIGSLAALPLTSVPVLDAWWDGQHLDVVHGPGRRSLCLEPGSIVSLLALGRDCRNVTISGVRWPLDDHHLQPLIGLGVSNEVTDPDGDVAVSASTGVLVVFNHPADDVLDPHSEGDQP